MEELSLHILDIVENSIKAGASQIVIRVNEEVKRDLLILEIEDNGSGMDRKHLRVATDPFYTTRTTRRVGLGLSLLEQSVKESGGELKIDSVKRKGTKLIATFRYSHIDRKPLGNMADTLVTLIGGSPGVDFLYEHFKTGRPDYRLDTRAIKAELEDIPINTIDVLQVIKNDIEQGLDF